MLQISLILLKETPSQSAANLTQHAFSIVSDLIRSITAIDVPLNYDSCAQMALRKFNH